MRIKLIGKDLFKYKDDRVERLGPMWEAKRWMERLMTKEDWNECMAAIEKLRRKLLKLSCNMLMRYESGGLECIDSKTIMSYCGIKDLERRLDPKLRPDVELMIRHKNGRLETIVASICRIW